MRESVVLLALLGITRGLCPQACSCPDVSTVNCSWASLHTFPSGRGLFTSLDLSHNLISDIAAGVFASQTSLQHVDISYNHIHHVPSTTFLSTPSLVWLSLSGNELHQLPNSFLESVSIKMLQLSHCDLHHVSAHAFQGLPKLKHLDLSHNSLLFISPSYFTSMHLEYLDISFNKISSVDVFSRPLQFLNLNLSYNLLTTIHRHTIMFLRNAIDTSSLQGNPWRCDCTLYRTYKWCTKEGIDMDIICHTGPHMLVGRSWSMFDTNGWCHMSDTFDTVSSTHSTTIQHISEYMYSILTSGVTLVIVMLAVTLWISLTYKMAYRDPKKGSEAKQASTPILAV